MTSAIVTAFIVCGAVLQAATLVFDAPKEWTVTPSKSSMRVAQYGLPKAQGDTEAGELIVYYFGQGQGGTVDANLERWMDQMQQPDGKPSKSVAKTSTMTVNGLKVTLLDVTGRYVAEAMPGSGQKQDKSGYRMRAAVVETAGGPYFVKLTGPQKTIARWDAEFMAFLKSARYK